MLKHARFRMPHVDVESPTGGFSELGAANAVHKAETIDHLEVLLAVTEIPANDVLESVYIDNRLGDVIACADLQCFFDRFGLRVGGNDDHRNIGIDLANRVINVVAVL